ncbi:PQQ-binding-like beta-propeller repeat protein [Streptomyces sp. JV185]|nr:PQQ-binding-like beta-propeller repeat protein [Streptomyces sp. JV185]MEE1769276.1 PQQ-binding-like beta-propeller repeat protein [Streptomyces sp. JV185]
MPHPAPSSTPSGADLVTTPDPTPPSSPSTPSHIGPYRVIRKLGGGGMGQVYLAVSRRLRPVAVKVVRPELAADPGFRTRFRTEVATAQAVNATYTAPVVGADPDAPQPWLATAYIPGPSLDAAVKDPGPLPEGTLRMLGGGLVEALVAVHRAGVVHGDLKPSNILLTSDRPRVIDFGISRAIDAGESSAGRHPDGSPEFMSPEQANGGDITPASDVFALGAVLVYAATGAPPFGSGRAEAVLSRVVHAPPALDGVPTGLLGTLTACLDKDPARRPSIEELRSQLPPQAREGWLGAVESQVIEAQRALRHDLRPPLVRRRLLVAGAVLAAAAGSGAAVLLRSSGADRPSALPELAWTARLPDSGMFPGALESTVLCTSNTTCASFDRTTGRPLWKDLSGQTKEYGADDRRVYAIRLDGRLHAYEARTGKALWTVAPNGAEAPELTLVTRELVVTRSGTANLQATDIGSGTVRWRAGNADTADGATPGGDVITWGNAKKGPPVMNLFGYSVLDKDTGRAVWSRDLTCVYASTTPEGRTVCYALDADRNLLALDPADGTTRWSKPTRLPAANNSTLMFTSSTLSLAGDTLFCYPGTGTNGATSGLLAAFDPETGASRWSVRTVARGNRGYVRSGSIVGLLDDKVLRGLNIRTGRARWEAGSMLAELRLLGTARGLILCAARKGLYAFDAGTGEQVWFHEVIGASGDWGGTVVGHDIFVTVATTLFCFTLAERG